MTLDWNRVQQVLYPIKDYEDLCQRMQASFDYSFVRSKFNLSLPELAVYTQKLLGGDSKHRYTEYQAELEQIIAMLQDAGVADMLDLKGKTDSRARLQEFTQQTGINGADTAKLLKFLIYWLIPPEKYLSGLVREDAEISEAIKVLKEQGIKTNLELLEAGSTSAGRKSLAEVSGLPIKVITELVNRADISRLPWTSKATISNIVGAGYGSVCTLASAEPETLFADFFKYGKKIGKNLKLGNEIENSHRIAKIVPMILEKE